jgi:hypothetical protein
MFSRGFNPASFLRAVGGTEPFRAYCRLRAIPFEPVPGDGRDTPLERWAAAVAKLSAGAQARVELDLAQVHDLSGPDATAHLLEASHGGDLPGDDIPSGPALALWFFVQRPDLFQDVFFRHEVAEVETWRTARAPANLPVPDFPTAAEALGREMREFFRQSNGAGRFCAVEAHRLPDAVCFAARVADRIQLVEGFTDDGQPSLQRVRPALAVLFAYRPADGIVRLKSPLRAADRVRDLFQRFGLSVLHEPVTDFGEGFDLDKLKRPVLLLPDAEDMEEVRLKTLHLRYPARLGRRGIRLETLPGDTPGAIEGLLKAHVGERAGELAVCHAEIQVRLRLGDRRKYHLIRLWPDRCNLNQTPLGERLRRCLSRWGLRYA